MVVYKTFYCKLHIWLHLFGIWSNASTKSSKMYMSHLGAHSVKCVKKKNTNKKAEKRQQQKWPKKWLFICSVFLGWFVCECQYCRNKNENGFILVFVVFSCDTRVMMNGIKVEEDEKNKIMTQKETKKQISWHLKLGITTHHIHCHEYMANLVFDFN